MKKKEKDIHDRIYKFILEVLKFIKEVPRTPENLVLIRQVVKSVTSIGANATEADGAESKKEFIYRFSVSKKEAKETKFWINLISDYNPRLRRKPSRLLEENEEIIAIVSKIIINAKKKKH